MGADIIYCRARDDGAVVQGVGRGGCSRCRHCVNCHILLPPARHESYVLHNGICLIVIGAGVGWRDEGGFTYAMYSGPHSDRGPSLYCIGLRDISAVLASATSLMVNKAGPIRRKLGC